MTPQAPPLAASGLAPPRRPAPQRRHWVGRVSDGRRAGRGLLTRQRRARGKVATARARGVVSARGRGAWLRAHPMGRVHHRLTPPNSQPGSGAGALSPGRMVPRPKRLQTLQSSFSVQLDQMFLHLKECLVLVELELPQSRGINKEPPEQACWTAWGGEGWSECHLRFRW